MMMNTNKAYWKEYFIYDCTKTLTGGSGTSFESASIKMDSDANFEIYKTTYVATSDKIKLKMRNDAIGQYIFYNPMDIKSLAGRNTLEMGLSNAFIPFIWPQPYLIPAGSTITVEAADFSGSSNTMRLALHGAKIRPGIPPWKQQYKYRKEPLPFIYGFSSALSVSANSTAIGRIEIDIDSNFLIYKVTGIRTGGATVNIVEGAWDRAWSNTAIHIDNLLGNGAFPNILPANRYVPRGSVISVNVTDLSGNTNSIEVNLIGVKLFV